MKRILIATIVLVSMLTAGTATSMSRRPPSVGVRVSIPLLPPVVVLEDEPYYVQDGYYYHYNDNRWFYSRSKQGPWTDLPRSHYPKEVKFKQRNKEQTRDRDRNDRGRNDRDRDDRGRDRRDDGRGHDNRR